MPAPTYASPCGRLVLYLGDNLDILPTLAPGSVDAIVSDPPYGISDGQRLGARGDDAGGRMQSMDHEWDRELPLEWITPAALALADGGAATVWSDKSAVNSKLREAMEMGGVKLLHNLFWNRTQASLNPRKNYGNCVEMAFFGRKPGRVLCWSGGNHRANLIRCPKVMPDERVHPTQKPVRVMEWCIAPITDVGMVVLDPFMGSGSTGVAALRMGRRFVGIERDEGYFEAARKRLEAEVNQGKLFDTGMDGVTNGR